MLQAARVLNGRGGACCCKLALKLYATGLEGVGGWGGLEGSSLDVDPLVRRGHSTSPLEPGRAVSFRSATGEFELRSMPSAFQ